MFVPDLSQAVAQFSGLGFEVIAGGQHTSTENALIVFEDDTYLELLALKPGFKRHLVRWAAACGFIGAMARRKRDVNWRLLRWVTYGYGCIDWCVRVDDVDQTLRAWAEAGVPGLGSEIFSRERPDGRVATWRLGSPRDTDLPFLLTDHTELSLRVPSPTRAHTNGALGIRQIGLSVPDVHAAAKRFDACFERSVTEPGGAPTYAIGSVRVKLVAAGHHVGKCALELRGDGRAPVSLDLGQTFGASMSLVPDAER